jgi:hypothetical protein
MEKGLRTFDWQAGLPTEPGNYVFSWEDWTEGVAYTDIFEVTREYDGDLYVKHGNSKVSRLSSRITHAKRLHYKGPFKTFDDAAQNVWLYNTKDP